MKKDKKNVVKPEGRFKHMLRTNYWLTPLLLVTLVFAIVFGVSKIPDLKNTVQGWFTKNEKCDQCTQLKYEAVKEKIAANEDGKQIYVIFTADDNEACKDLYEKLDPFLKTNKTKEDIVIYNVDITKKDDKFVDKTLTEDIFANLNDEFSSLELGMINAPTIVRYVGKDMHSGLTGTTDYNGLVKFFIDEKVA